MSKLSFDEVFDMVKKGELEECEKCSTTGIIQETETCDKCNGLGFIEEKQEV